MAPSGLYNLTAVPQLLDSYSLFFINDLLLLYESVGVEQFAVSDGKDGEDCET